MQTLDTFDWIAISIYFLVLLGIALWVIRKKENNTEDYFLAGRNVGWFVVGASIFASNIGSEHVVGLAGAGAGDRLPMLIYEIQAWIGSSCPSTQERECSQCPSFWKNVLMQEPDGFFPYFPLWPMCSPKFP